MYIYVLGSRSRALVACNNILSYIAFKNVPIVYSLASFPGSPPLARAIIADGKVGWRDFKGHAIITSIGTALPLTVYTLYKSLYIHDGSFAPTIAKEN